MGKEGDISANAPESSAITVDQIDLELSPLSGPAFNSRWTEC